MNPTDRSDALRKARDFLTVLLNSTPEAATDLLTNAGEEALANLQLALGVEAFVPGENVIASPADAQVQEFTAIVKSARVTDAGTVLFTVEDQDGDCFDCTAGEITVEPASLVVDTAPLFEPQHPAQA